MTSEQAIEVISYLNSIYSILSMIWLFILVATIIVVFRFFGKKAVKWIHDRKEKKESEEKNAISK